MSHAHIDGQTHTTPTHTQHSHTQTETPTHRENQTSRYIGQPS